MRTIVRVCSPAAVILCILGGCSRSEAPKTVSPPQVQPVVQESLQNGEILFRQYCFSCHPDGGNVSDPKRSLRGSDLQRNHITSPEDIVKIMRNPLSRMIRFDAGTVPDKDARLIAEYILRTFK